MPRVSVNGVGLQVTELGQGKSLVLLHGFTGSGAHWLPLAEALADERRCVMIDLLGHGSSDAPANAERYGMAHCIADLTEVLDFLGIERPDLLGYSMGGRVALAMALARPDRFGALLLEGASPGIPDAAQRADRRAQDAHWADLIEREGIETFADAWIKQPLFASQARLGATTLVEERRRRCANSPAGLANSLRGLGTGTQTSLWGRLSEVQAATLLIAGAEDEKFRNIAGDMAVWIPRAEMCVIPEAGHTTHLENPATFEDVVRDFLHRTARVPVQRCNGEG